MSFRSRPTARPIATLLLQALLIFVAVGVGAAAPASAHQTGKSTFVVHVKPETGVVDTLLASPARDAADGAFGYGQGEVDWTLEAMKEKWLQIGGYLDRSVTVTNDGRACEVTELKTSEPTGADAMWFLKAFRCEKPLGAVTLTNTAMVDKLGGYKHFARIQIGEDEEVQTTVFNALNRSFTVSIGADKTAEPQSALDQFLRYLWEGILHILIGLDHVLFVLGLVLISSRLKQLLTVITAFTLSHSVTLALSALDVVAVPPSIVEPVIALSVAWVAVEAIANRDDPRIAYVATFLLGFVHGFGFSYVLRDEVGLPTEALLPALLAFNVGVEMGQLGIVALAYPLRAWLRNSPAERKVVVALAALIAVIALYWFVERVFF